MRVLVVGGGGREHALAWGLAQSPRVGELLAAPGNAGIAQIASCLPVEAEDIEGIAGLVEARDIDLVVVGPRRRSSRAWPTPFATEDGRSSGPAATPLASRARRPGRRS